MGQLMPSQVRTDPPKAIVRCDPGTIAATITPRVVFPAVRPNSDRSARLAGS